MSLQQQKRLAELKEESTHLAEQRERVLLEKKSQMIEGIKSEAIEFLKSEGFRVNEAPQLNTITSDYKGLNLQIKYSKVDEWFFGAHSMFVIEHNKREYKVSASLETESLPLFQGMFTSPQQKLEQEIKHYEELVPKQRELGTSDISGNYNLKLIKSENGANSQPTQKTQSISNITEAINAIFEV